MPPTPSSPMYSSSEGFDEPDAGLRKRSNRVSPYPEEEAFAWDVCYGTDRPLGPRTAGDGSDNPDELSATPSSKNFHSTHVSPNTAVMQTGMIALVIFKFYVKTCKIALKTNYQHREPNSKSQNYNDTYNKHWEPM